MAKCVRCKILVALILALTLLLTCAAWAEAPNPEKQAAQESYRDKLAKLNKNEPENTTPALLWEWAKSVTAYTMDSNGDTYDLNCGIYADIDPYKLEIGFGHGLSPLASCLYYNQDIFDNTDTMISLKPVGFQHRFGLAGELLEFLADNRDALMRELDAAMTADDRYKVLISIIDSDKADRVYVITYWLDSGESNLTIV